MDSEYEVYLKASAARFNERSIFIGTGRTTTRACLQQKGSMIVRTRTHTTTGETSYLPVLYKDKDGEPEISKGLMNWLALEIRRVT